jgi:hypothetical protein
VSRKLSTEPDAAPHPDDWGPRIFEATGFSSYRMSVTKADIVFTVNRLRREREELLGELIVTCPLAGARTVNGVLSSGDFNLSSVQARATRAKHLAQRALTNDIDWEGWLHELCLSVLTAERTGQPAQLITDIPPNENGGEFDVMGLMLPRRDPAILFGDGGSAKSLFALYASGILARQGELVMFCDWESSGPEHRDRFLALFPVDPPGVLYVRCDRPLEIEQDRLRALALEHGITYAIFDSAAYGCKGAPESAEAAIGYFRAVRSLGTVGTLIVAHVTKAEEGDKRPFGSGFWHNSARSTWNMKRSNPEDDNSPDINVLISQRKCNQGRLRPPFAMCVTFGQATTVFTRTSAAAVPDFAMSLTLMQRVRAAVKYSPLGIEALRSEFPDQKPDTLLRIVRRGVERGILVKRQVPGGQELIGIQTEGS